MTRALKFAYTPENSHILAMNIAKWAKPYAKRLKTWGILSPLEILDIIEDIELILSQKQNRPCCEIHSVGPEKQIGILGEYDPNSPTIITIRTFLLKANHPRQALDSLIHEGRHAYQYDSICNPQKHSEAQKYIEIWRETCV